MVERYKRFTLSDRLEHVVQIVAFTALALTGIPQRYPGAGISKWLIDLMGGIESVRNIHRVFATILMISIVYHLGAIGYRKYVERRPRAMLPGKADLTAAAHSVRYLLGREDSPPRQGRFTWEEKVEYYALVWGTLVMVITGFLLWNPIATSKLLPGQFIPAAKVFHSGEALLAVLAIIVWHMYHVHVRHFNTSMFTGYMSRAEMEREHALELEQLEAQGPVVPRSGPRAKRRARFFFPAFAGVAAILLAGIYFFVTFEETAIATIEPPEQVEVFAPVETSGTTQAPETTQVTGTTTPTTAPPTTAVLVMSWDEGISAIFSAQRCTDCHGRAMALGGIELVTYSGALAAIVPGDPDASLLVIVQESGDHATLLDQQQLEQVRAWVAAGAPETGGSAPPGGPSTGAAGWDDTISSMFSSCLSCHGSSQQMGGLDLSSYEGALAAVTPGDPASSVLYTLQAAGGHAGQLDEANLAVLESWIADGALEVAAGPTDEGQDDAVATDASWDASIMTLLSACSGCHGAASPMAGLDLTTLEGTLAAIDLESPEDSVLLGVQIEGGHPGQLSDADIELLRAWIAAGAP